MLREGYEACVGEVIYEYDFTLASSNTAQIILSLPDHLPQPYSPTVSRNTTTSADSCRLRWQVNHTDWNQNDQRISSFRFGLPGIVDSKSMTLYGDSGLRLGKEETLETKFICRLPSPLQSNTATNEVFLARNRQVAFWRPFDSSGVLKRWLSSFWLKMANSHT